MAEDPVSELMRAIAEELTPVKLGDRLSNIGKAPSSKPIAPRINQRLPRIVPNDKGELIDLNTGKVVGRTSAADTPGIVNPLSKIPGAFLSGLNESGNQILSDINDLMSGKFAGPLGRMAQVAGELPIGRLAKGGKAAVQNIVDTKTWKLMQPEARAVLNNIADTYPALFKKVMDSPTKLMASITENMPGLLGSMGITKISKEVAKKAGQPNLTDTPTHGIMNLIPKAARDKVTPVHEIEHFLKFPKIQATDPADAGTIGLLLSDLLPRKEQGSLARRISEYYSTVVPQSPPRTAGGPNVSQNWKAMSPAQRAVSSAYTAPAELPRAQELVNAGAGYYKTGEPMVDFLGRTMMDEGLAHLSEQTVKSSKNQPLMDLAMKLGVGTGLKSIPNDPRTTEVLSPEIKKKLMEALGVR